MPPNHSFIHDLIDWGVLHQSTLHPNVEIYQDSVTGLSFRAKNAQPRGSLVVTSSHQISLSYLNAIDSQGFSCRSESFPGQFLNALSENDPNIIGHFFLMQQYLKQDSSFWWPYIRLLPQPDQPQSLRIPMWWPSEDRKFLDGTNAEPPLRKRKDLWRVEWSKGIALLQGHLTNWQDYSYVLYQWAATIFGSRSFRASLTVQESIVPDPVIIEHVRHDRFSVLLPILDIGNHNGFDNVEWVPDHKGLSLRIRDPVPARGQIFNYYGNKSNSELLVAYGFTLPINEASNIDRDVVNLKLKPNPEALLLRRSQHCHEVPRVAEEEYTFMVQRLPFRQGGFFDLGVFSDGLVDLIICMVANNREKRYIAATPGYCPENDASLMESPLARSALQTLSVLYAKLYMEQKRIEETGIGLSRPNNHNQRIALDYRHRQLAVLSSASLRIKKRLDAALTICSFCQHTNHTISSNSHGGLDNFHQHVELLSLECAFEWLRLNYPEIFTVIVNMIAEDQEELLPLNWAVLVEDWNHAYWVVWIFTIWLLWRRDGESFRHRHKNLSSWLLQMNEAFDCELASDKSSDILYADTSEIETINFMTEGIVHMPQIADSAGKNWLAEPSSVTRLRNFASFVAQEETFSVGNYMQESAQKLVEQRVLCINKRTGNEDSGVGGAWTSFFSGAV